MRVCGWQVTAQRVDLREVRMFVALNFFSMSLDPR
jgi:hypothetical protein